MITLLLPLPWHLSTGIALLIGASLFWQWRHGAFMAAGEWHLADDGTCYNTETASGDVSRRYRVIRAHRDPGSVRLLLEDPEKRRRRLLIARDAVDPETYRELCARIVQRRLPVRDPAVH